MRINENISNSYLFKNLFAMNGLELAKLLDERPKPNDIKSANSMILTNKDNKKKTLN